MASTPVHAGWAGLPTLGNNAHSVTYTDSMGQVVWRGDSTRRSRRARLCPACAAACGARSGRPPLLWRPLAGATSRSDPPRPDRALTPPAARPRPNRPVLASASVPSSAATVLLQPLTSDPCRPADTSHRPATPPHARLAVSYLQQLSALNPVRITIAFQQLTVV